jgi:hypothetical protein
VFPDGGGTIARHNLELTRSAGRRDDNKVQQEVISLSKQKWQWMAERNVEALSGLFHEDAVFVHRGNHAEGSGTRGMSRPLLKFGGGSVEILRDVLR